MAKKKNRMQERFASGVAAGLKPSAAYIGAGYSPKYATENSFRLMQKPYIQERIAQLRQLAMNKVAEQELVKEQERRTEAALSGDAFKGRIVTIERWVHHVLNMIDECKDTNDMTNNRGFTEMLAKHLGAYDADNRQKKPAQLLQVNIERDTNPKRASEIYSEIIKNVGDST